LILFFFFIVIFLFQSESLVKKSFEE